jgi:hypothetical protein
MPEPERFAFALTRATNASSLDDLRRRRIDRQERKSPDVQLWQPNMREGEREKIIGLNSLSTDTVMQ